MKWDQVTFERLLVALILLLAVGVRLFNLGLAPLSDGEASWALQSLSIARGDPVEIEKYNKNLPEVHDVLKQLRAIVTASRCRAARSWPSFCAIWTA